MKILLLQARAPDDPIREVERRCFARKAALDEECFVPYDLLTGPPSLDEVRSYDALMVGGSGDYYVSNEDLPGFPALMDFLSEVVEVGHPTFASCFGFQLMVNALGGEIIHDPDAIEVGTFELALTGDGAADPLFGYLPQRFRAQVGRKDRAERLPSSVIHLASSERSRYHAFRIPEKPIWATQFHAEMNHVENRARFIRYMDDYAPNMNAAQREAALGRFVESPETVELIPRFLKLVLG